MMSQPIASQPTWQSGSTILESADRDAVLNTWLRANEALQAIVDAVDDVKHPPSKEARNIAARIDSHLIDILGWVCGEIRRVLYETPFPIGGSAGLASDRPSATERYLVEFVSPVAVDELTGFLTNLLHDLATAKIEGWPEYITRFFDAWLGRVAGTGLNSTSLWRNINLAVQWDDSASMDAAGDLWTSQLGRLLADYRARVVRAQAASDAGDAVESAQRSAQLAAQAAGVAGTASISTYFTDLAKSERRVSRFWSGVVPGALAATAAVAGGTLWFLRADTWVEQLLHLSLTLPFAVLAAYAASLSAHHRRSWWWAQATAVQLRSVGGFVEQLNAEQKAEILHDVGVRVFGAPEIERSNKIDDASVLSIAATVIEQLKIGSAEK
ncbi:hypothetical protein [Williamsia sp. D3]|uniref:hypothetical protein n=1 Tax=Williamsia TaxID=85043 RepID=UPI0003D2D35D|nr:hypothetical protein [Williamsia sp. D3]ETD30977.1 hypothetical protein W823_21840 [Williamsia sp. D3]